MLEEIKIQDFAIIKELSLKYGPGLNILSGETGAGKTIIVESLNMILGNRAEPKLVRTGEKEALIEACFKLNKESRAKISRLTGEEAPGELFISRKISSDGSSRAYLGGRSVSASLLGEIGGVLVDIHGQNQHQSLLDPKIQLELLDAYGREETESLLYKLSSEIKSYREISSRLNEKEQNTKEIEDKLELLRYQEDELKRAALSAGEEEELRGKRERLKNIAKVEESLGAALFSLKENDDSAEAKIYQAEKALRSIASVNKEFEEFSRRAESLYREIKELALDITDSKERGEQETGGLEEIEQRLDLIVRLKEKYNAVSVEDLNDKLQKIRSELQRIDHAEEDITALRAEADRLKKIVLQIAIDLRKARKEHALELKQEIAEELSELAMSDARFEIAFDGPKLDGERENGIQDISERGADRIEFLFSSNKGEEPKPVKKIVSGGEMSRVMLAFKKILAEQDSLETLVFDEIDAGIGGKTAFAVGRRLSELAATHQVICLTHIPQIACYADRSFRIEKKESGGRTLTSAVELDEEARVREIARMLSGEKVTETALKNAAELIREKSGAEIAGTLT